MKIMLIGYLPYCPVTYKGSVFIYITDHEYMHYIFVLKYFNFCNFISANELHILKRNCLKKKEYL